MELSFCSLKCTDISFVMVCDLYFWVCMCVSVFVDMFVRVRLEESVGFLTAGVTSHSKWPDVGAGCWVPTWVSERATNFLLTLEPSLQAQNIMS